MKTYTKNKLWVIKIDQTSLEQGVGWSLWGGRQGRFFQEELKRVTNEVYKQKIVPNVPCSNMKRVWEGVSLMSGHKGKKGSSSGLCSATREYDDELNDFYCLLTLTILVQKEIVKQELLALLVKARKRR